MALVLTPCADKGDCNEFKQTEISQTTHQQQHADEVCTPFCMCSCCASHFIASGVKAELGLTATITTIYTHHSAPGVRGAIASIWQPPKLS